MNEEIEYAEMLEIPVSTVNVVRKNRRKKKTEQNEPLPVAPLKESVIAQVNDRLEETLPEPTETPEFSAPEAETNTENTLDFDPEPVPERIDTVRLYASESKRGFFKRKLHPQDYSLSPEEQNEGGRYALNDESRSSKLVRITLGAEFAVACALCAAIFFTNVFMPNSGINTFFRSLSDPTETAAKTDNRAYSDFELSPVVSEFSDAELTLSEAGVLSFTDECCVYPAADGKISEVTKADDGLYTVKISHSNTFTGVIQGLDYVYYAVGDEVKSNVPVGFSKGENEVQVTMYSGGELLNCFELTEENCLAWVTEGA